MLLVVGTEAAVVRTAVLDLGAEGQRNGARLVVLAVGDVGLRVAVDERLEGPQAGHRFRM